MGRREAEKVVEEFNEWANRVFSSENYKLGAVLHPHWVPRQRRLKLYSKLRGNFIGNDYVNTGDGIYSISLDQLKQRAIELALEHPDEFNVNILDLTEEDREEFESYLSDLRKEVVRVEGVMGEQKTYLGELDREYTSAVKRKESLERVLI